MASIKKLFWPIMLDTLVISSVAKQKLSYDVKKKKYASLTFSSQGAGAMGFTVGSTASADFFKNIFFPSENLMFHKAI